MSSNAAIKQITTIKCAESVEIDNNESSKDIVEKYEKLYEKCETVLKKIKKKGSNFKKVVSII